MEDWVPGRHKRFVGGTKHTSGDYEIVPAHSAPGARWHLRHQGQKLGSFKHLADAKEHAELRHLAVEARQESADERPVRRKRKKE